MLSGLVMALALLSLGIIFPPTRFHYGTNIFLWLIIGGLFYFIVPLLLSFFVSWNTGQRTIGYKTGMLTGGTTAILVLLTLGVFFVISAITTPSQPGSVDTSPLSNSALFQIFVGSVVIHGCGCLIASMGASAGGALGSRFVDYRARFAEKAPLSISD